MPTDMLAQKLIKEQAQRIDALEAQIRRMGQALEMLTRHAADPSASPGDDLAKQAHANASKAQG